VTTNQFAVGAPAVVQQHREEEEEISRTAASVHDTTALTRESVRHMQQRDLRRDEGHDRHTLGGSADSSHEHTMTATSATTRGAESVSAGPALVTVSSDILCAQCHRSLRGLQAFQFVVGLGACVCVWCACVYWCACEYQCL
jgi:hypothetical protein